jgi:hypothetical protein
VEAGFSFVSASALTRFSKNASNFQEDQESVKRMLKWTGGDLNSHMRGENAVS